ncbi:nucleoside/nucleotide kinase family protein [Phycicoccus endophyticus]|uniref:Nucleoside/nucleotide kinase family protein n=1 Tax=Phycicoccus endophyticus TaxID=1690220 RepID=A0A7G9R013_9MICO|nr:nucleoside/nucleotide kinase family protein [Phycicoccus endophyticus]NHI20800.1 nucleoside/nucleotide kinase family protein [Phycicoccus endophyticus]QNN48938.1 nucleoside/nucleotide kinase family protein [Phycicoccus endophyticus]GGL44086.1 nucleoside/nucleotide kinase family protein [Phycicoccus endophyticus]
MDTTATSQGGPGAEGVEALARAVADLVPPQGRALLGIAGVPGVGKTTLVEALLERLGHTLGPDVVAHVPMDGFHLADVQLDRLGLRDRKGAPETFDVGGYAALLRRLRVERGPVYAPGFERTLEQPLAGALVVPERARLVLTEGNYLLLATAAWRAVREALDEVWWLEDDDGTRRERLVARHERFGKAPAAARSWVETVDEANAALIRGTAAAPDRVVLEGPRGWSLRG